MEQIWTNFDGKSKKLIKNDEKFDKLVNKLQKARCDIEMDSKFRKSFTKELKK